MKREYRVKIWVSVNILLLCLCSSRSSKWLSFSLAPPAVQKVTERGRKHEDAVRFVTLRVRELVQSQLHRDRAL